MQSLRPARQLSEVALQHLGVAVEERPCVSRVELLVARLPPFLEQVRQFPIGQNTDFHRTDHDVVNLFISEVVLFVSLDALVVVLPSGHELADRALDQGDKVPADEPGVFAGHANLSREGKIVADEHQCTVHETGGKRLVVRVADAQHVGVVLLAQFSATDSPSPSPSPLTNYSTLTQTFIGNLTTSDGPGQLVLSVKSGAVSGQMVSASGKRQKLRRAPLNSNGSATIPMPPWAGGALQIQLQDSSDRKEG